MQIPGWRTSRKIVVIESDDWGSIRMPNRAVYTELKQKGYHVDKCPFSRYDSLASSDDLSALYDVLRSVRDKNGNHAVITADSVVANPDFDAIRANGFSRYVYEPFTKTLERYGSSHRDSFELWKQGMHDGIFYPQFHGREHLNVVRWMQALQAGDEVTRLAFDQHHFGISSTVTSQLKVRYMDAFGNTSAEALEEEQLAIEEGTALFENLFGYRSQSMIAPCYIWRTELEKAMLDNGIKYIQGLPIQQIPIKEDPLRVQSRYHYLGQKNRLGQYYLTRNAFFEPYKGTGVRELNACLERINIAFRWHKPAIISSHRINFIGSIIERNRSENLQLFKTLLTSIIKRWPDVEFMTSDMIGRLIEK